jgi:hypothetical protein
VGEWENKTNLRKHAKLLARHLPLLHGLPHAIVAPLHQPPLQPHGITQVPVPLDVHHTGRRRQRLQLAVELPVQTLRQQQQEVQARHLVPLPLFLSTVLLVREEFVKRAQLRDVAREGVGVLGADGRQRALLVGVAREGEVVRGRRGRGGEGIELEEEELGAREEGGRLGVGGGGGRFEVGEELG